MLFKKKVQIEVLKLHSDLIMFATVISQNKKKSGSLLLSNGLSPQPPPFFHRGHSTRPRCTNSTTPRPRLRLTSPTAGPLSFFSGPPLEHKQKTSKSAWVGRLDHSIHRILMNLRHNPPQPWHRPNLATGRTTLCLKLLRDFFVQCEGVIKKRRKN